MTRTAWTLALLLLPACDFLSSETPEETPTEPAQTPTPPPRPIAAPPVPEKLLVTSGEISVVTVKNGDTEVPGTFTGLSGRFKFADGVRQQGLSGSLLVDLSTWDSGLDERDERVKNLFFQVADHPKATFLLTGMEGLPADGIPVGSEAMGTAHGRVVLHRNAVDVDAKVKFRHSGEHRYHISSVEPFYVSIQALGMMGPLKALMTACGHKSVDDNVKLSVSLDLGPLPPKATVDSQAKKSEGRRHTHPTHPPAVRGHPAAKRHRATRDHTATKH